MALGQIAQLNVTCPQCEKWTSIYVLEDGKPEARVKCQHCKGIFVFGAGMAYDPVGYVAAIPAWAKIGKSDEDRVFSQAVKCKKCGYEYTDGDSAIHDTFSQTASQSDSPLGAMLFNSPAFKGLLGVKVLFKCGSCSKIACSECALESDGITQKKCPFCKSDYTAYSEIDASNTSASNATGTIIYPGKSKKTAVLLWFLSYFGCLGIHNFYLGQLKQGLIKLGLFVLSIIITILGAAAEAQVFITLDSIIALASIIMLVPFIWGIVDIYKLGKTHQKAFGKHN